ncbi:MAG: excinuclease subunit [Gammaproteobacteria bacterium]|jgi:excinuclease ABC subunit C|nr:excinuclease subunit [Gammaproteobacteria bacterium]
MNETLNQFDIPSFLKNLSSSPGVYRMLDKKGEIIYVGKAKNLKKRVSSYFNRQHEDAKTQSLVEHIVSIEVTLTLSEKEALILESTLIKQHRPRYNIVFRDDKSYPYIYLSKHDFPRITTHRGRQSKEGIYFGPYPNMSSVKATLNLLQKIFPVRQCEDAFFKNRTRPCLQYQIKRCSGPCVGLVGKDEYRQEVEHVKLFFQGKNQAILKSLADKMEQASERLAFEEAARLRNQLMALQKLQEQQAVSIQSESNVDVIALSEQHGQYCVQVLYIRVGRLLGNKTYFPKVGWTESRQEVLEAFLEQFYTTGLGAKSLPDDIILSEDLKIEPALIEVLSELHGAAPKFTSNPRGPRAKWLEMAKLNADQALISHLAAKQNVEQRMQRLQEVLTLPKPIHRIECFDISHSQGELTVASCVVFDENGPLKKLYRHFNIEGIKPGDDYAAMHQVLTRRYQRAKKENQPLPDLILIDGGKGQLSQATQVLKQLEIEGILLLGLAKGTTRKIGFEQIWQIDKKLPLMLDSQDPALLLIRQIDEEAHRFAITGHRGKREKKRSTSTLEEIAGVGPKRRQALLRHFGGWREVKNATIDELCKVKGISPELAKHIQLMLSS